MMPGMFVNQVSMCFQYNRLVLEQTFPDIWKIEGLDTAEDCEKVAAAIKTGDRENVIAVVLGRGATDEKVNEWLRAGSSVEGYKGFAIGRSIFWNALKGFHEGEMTREEAKELHHSLHGICCVGLG